MNFKIALVDDEESVLENEKLLFEEFSNESNASFEVERYSDPLLFVNCYSKGYDIILLDIEMPNMNGLEVAKKIREVDGNVVIIFVTNMTQYAIDGYSVNAYDYILKPIKKYAFNLKLEKLIKKLALVKGSQMHIKSEGRIIVVDPRDISFIESRGHYVEYHIKNKGYLSYERMVDVEKKLPDSFFRCSRYYLVNLGHVSQIVGETLIIDGFELKISRGDKKTFVDRFMNYLRGGAA